ncbi:MAG: hypothetical protein MI746_10345 [Pseudomonadales bacterium]|nr:hypothetical protein [Pseudomonadales bacterium]
MRPTKALSYVIALLFITNFSAAEELTIDFSYERNVNIGSIRPALKLAEFGDDRSTAGNALVEDYTVNAPLAEIVRDAFAQGFAKGEVELVTSGEDMQIVGTIVSAEAESIDRAGVPSIQLTIRTRIQLQGGGRTIWENTLFGRGRVPETEGMGAAVNASLERMVRELFSDDYFLIELQ